MNTTTILGIIVALAIGGTGGYFAGKNGTDTSNADQVAEMAMMMKDDGTRMEKAGGMMMTAGMMMEERGTKNNDQEMVMMGKDLSASGRKHQDDGKSMVAGDMMGMTAGGNMSDMPGMDMSGMKM